MATWWHRVCGCASASVKNPALGDDTASTGRRPYRGGGTVRPPRHPSRLPLAGRGQPPAAGLVARSSRALWLDGSVARVQHARRLQPQLEPAGAVAVGAEVPDDIEDDVWRAHLMVDRA